MIGETKSPLPELLHQAVLDNQASADSGNKYTGQNQLSEAREQPVTQASSLFGVEFMSDPLGGHFI